MNVFFALKGSKLFIIIISDIVNDRVYLDKFIASSVGCIYFLQNLYFVNRYFNRSRFILKFRFVSFLLNVPVNNFSVMSHPGYYQYFWEVNVSCTWTQHGDLRED